MTSNSFYTWNKLKNEDMLMIYCMYFNCSVFKRFQTLNPEAVGENKKAKLHRETILSLPELQV